MSNKLSSLKIGSMKQAISRSVKKNNSEFYCINPNRINVISENQKINSGEEKQPTFKSFLLSHTKYYPVCLHLTYMWSFGFLALIAILMQVITGLLLSCHYIATIDEAYDSIQYIMRDVNHGWFIRYTHLNGASGLFVLLYCHILRGIYYKCYRAPRSKVWVSGMLLYVLIMATAFTGYVLPWGQMSLWGATVITGLLGVVPLIGGTLVEWLLGGVSVTDATLRRFYSIHYILPFIIIAFSILHIILLHKAGSSDPLGNGEVKSLNVPFYPNVLLKDLVALWVYVFILMYFVHFDPTRFGHPENLIRADALSTPPHIVPEWYFLPFYAILRAVPNKILGIVAMFSAIGMLFLLPLIDSPKAMGSTYMIVHRFIFWFWVNNNICLGWLGSKPAVYPYAEFAFYFTVGYFLFFIAVYFHTKYENIKQT